MMFQEGQSSQIVGPLPKKCMNLKPVIQNGLSYIRDSGHFLEKIDGVGEIPENTLFATTYVVSLYPSIPHKTGLSAVKEALHK